MSPFEFACGLWTAARLGFGVIHASPLAPEPMWVPQLAPSHGAHATASARVDGFFGALVALFGDAYFLWDSASLALTESAPIGELFAVHGDARARILVGVLLFALGLAKRDLETRRDGAYRDRYQTAVFDRRITRS